MSSIEVLWHSRFHSHSSTSIRRGRSFTLCSKTEYYVSNKRVTRLAFCCYNFSASLALLLMSFSQHSHHVMTVGDDQPKKFAAELERCPHTGRTYGQTKHNSHVEKVQNFN